MTNADRARRWFAEVWKDGGEAIVLEMAADHVTGSMEGIEVHNRDEFLAARHQLLATFPDLDLVVEDVIAEGDRAAVRWHAAGTHAGGGLGVPPTNRRVTFRGMTWLQFENDRIVRGWDSWNLGGLLQTLSE